MGNKALPEGPDRTLVGGCRHREQVPGQVPEQGTHARTGTKHRRASC